VKDCGALATDHDVVDIVSEGELLDLLASHVVGAARHAVDVREAVVREAVRLLLRHFIGFEAECKDPFVLGPGERIVVPGKARPCELTRVSTNIVFLDV